MKILVTGANGQLGNEMRIVSKGTLDEYIFTDVSQVEGLETTYLDITDLNAIRTMVQENDVRVIVNCAAWTNVDGAEAPEKYDLVEKLNATAPENLAKAMKEVGGLLIQISTDYVFGKEPYNVPCRENQQGTPTGVYGLTKLHGEQKIMKVFTENLSHQGDRGGYVIIRTAWLYSEYGKNFCKTMLNLTATKPALKVVFDQCGTPTYALDLANTIKAIVADYKEEVQNENVSKNAKKADAHSAEAYSADAYSADAYSADAHSADAYSTDAYSAGAYSADAYSKSGVYHFSNEGVCSWYDFTKMIQEYSGHSDCDVQPCHSNEFPSPVTRPAYSVLDKTKIKETFGVTVPCWTDSLKKCISHLINI